jgi:hypothetical protein
MFEFDTEVFIKYKVRRLIHSSYKTYNFFNKLRALIYRPLLHAIHTTIRSRRDEAIVQGLSYADKPAFEGFKVQSVLFGKFCLWYQVADAFAESLRPYNPNWLKCKVIPDKIL